MHYHRSAIAELARQGPSKGRGISAGGRDATVGNWKTDELDIDLAAEGRFSLKAKLLSLLVFQKAHHNIDPQRAPAPDFVRQPIAGARPRNNR